MQKLPHFILVLFLVISFQGNAQNITKDSIVGTWKVENLKFDRTKIPADRREMVEPMLALFKQSTIVFLKDGNFNWNAPMEDMQMKNKQWKFNPVTNKVTVTEWNDTKNMMAEFFVKEMPGYILLIMQD